VCDVHKSHAVLSLSLSLYLSLPLFHKSAMYIGVLVRAIGQGV